MAGWRSCTPRIPTAPLAYFLAEHYFIAQRYDKAETLYRKLLEEVPALPAYRNLAEIYRKSGRHVQLLEVLGEAVAKTGGLDVLGEAGEAILRTSRWSAR